MTRLCSVEARGKRKSATFPDMHCSRCGNTCKRGSPAQRFCKPCAKEVSKQGEANRTRSARTVVGHPLSCRRCCLVVVATGAGQKYCQPCAKEVTREKDKATKKILRRSAEAKAKARERAAISNFAPGRRDYIRNYERNRRQTDPKFAINARMKAMVSNVLRGEKNGRSWRELVGYTADELLRHLERQFLPGMTWENRSRWQIDHILPVSSFTFQTAEDDEFRACWALTNLRPLWKEKNREKWFHRTHLI